MTETQQKRWEELKATGWKNLQVGERVEFKELKTASMMDKFGKEEKKESMIDNEQLETLNKKMSLLMKAVDTNKLSDQEKSLFEEHFPKKKTMPLIRLNFWEGDLIIKWKLSKDVVKMEKGSLLEDQKLMLTLVTDYGTDAQKEKEIEIEYSHFKFKDQKVFELLEEPAKNKEGDYVYRVMFEEKPLAITNHFIN